MTTGVPGARPPAAGAASGATAPAGTTATPHAARRLAVVGAGWAGLAGAVAALQRGWAVTVYEMAAQPGGRARSVARAQADDCDPLDNGQHLLIGAYSQSLALLRTVGVDPDRALWRGALQLVYPDGNGLVLPPGAPALAFARGVLGARGWTWRDKAALLAAAAGWAARGFRCPPAWSVAQLCRRLPPRIQRQLVEPLCVAALNTPAEQASASVFLRVLHDALFSGAGGADLLLPRQPLSALLADPAWHWLQRRGAECHTGHRVQRLAAAAPSPGQRTAGWMVDDQRFDAVLLACSAREAARLAQPLAPEWARGAAALAQQPIITVYLRSHGQAPTTPANAAAAAAARPMWALAAADNAPAQFAFDLGAIGRASGRFAFVVSGAAPWVARGLDTTAEAVRRQAEAAFPGRFADPGCVLQVLAEKRATFACTPALQRPATVIAPALVAAGDYVDGPYPATLEGAVRSGNAALAALATQATAAAADDRPALNFAMQK